MYTGLSDRLLLYGGAVPKGEGLILRVGLGFSFAGLVCVSL